MSKLVGSTGQYTGSEYLFDASGTIASGGTAQLLLPRAKSRSSLIIQNISDTNMLIEIGGARATAALSNGTVASCAITNAGMGFTKPPSVMFLGGGYTNQNQITPTFTLPGCPCWPSPSNPAQAHCLMTGAAGAQTVSSIVIDNPGSGYAYPPYVFLINDPSDPYGSAAPSATSGIELISSGGSYTSNGTICTTDQIAIFCATSSKAFTCKFST